MQPTNFDPIASIKEDLAASIREVNPGSSLEEQNAKLKEVYELAQCILSTGASLDKKNLDALKKLQKAVVPSITNTVKGVLFKSSRSPSPKSETSSEASSEAGSLESLKQERSALVEKISKAIKDFEELSKSPLPILDKDIVSILFLSDRIDYALKIIKSSPNLSSEEKLKLSKEAIKEFVDSKNYQGAFNLIRDLSKDLRKKLFPVLVSEMNPTEALLLPEEDETQLQLEILKELITTSSNPKSIPKETYNTLLDKVYSPIKGVEEDLRVEVKLLLRKNDPYQEIIPKAPIPEKKSFSFFGVIGSMFSYLGSIIAYAFSFRSKEHKIVPIEEVDLVEYEVPSAYQKVNEGSDTSSDASSDISVIGKEEMEPEDTPPLSTENTKKAFAKEDDFIIALKSALLPGSDETFLEIFSSLIGGQEIQGIEMLGNSYTLALPKAFNHKIVGEDVDAVVNQLPAKFKKKNAGKIAGLKAKLPITMKRARVLVPDSLKFSLRPLNTGDIALYFPEPNQSIFVSDLPLLGSYGVKQVQYTSSQVGPPTTRITLAQKDKKSHWIEESALKLEYPKNPQEKFLPILNTVWERMKAAPTKKG